MTRKMGRGLGIAMMIFVSMAASARAQSWVSIPLPTISGWGGTVLNTVAPWALGYPPCSNHCNSHYESSLESGVKGFRIRGDMTRIGSGGTNGGNLLSAFFSDSVNYIGNEYGLFVPLDDGNLYLYQCWNGCNTRTQQFAQTLVWSNPGAYYVYEVQVNTDGSYTVNVVTPVSNQIVATVQVPLATGNPPAPNLYGSSGYLTISAQHWVNDGSNYTESVLHVDEIDILQ